MDMIRTGEGFEIRHPAFPLHFTKDQKYLYFKTAVQTASFAFATIWTVTSSVLVF